MTAPTNGIDTVLVVLTATLTGTLSLKMNSASGGPTLTANAAAITVSIPAGGSFTYKSPVVAGGQRVSAFLSKIVGTDPASCNVPAYRLDLINPNGTVVAFDKECSKTTPGFAELDPTKTAITGTWSVRIRNNSPATGAYTIAFYSYKDKTVASSIGHPADVGPTHSGTKRLHHHCRYGGTTGGLASHRSWRLGKLEPIPAHD